MSGVEIGGKKGGMFIQKNDAKRYEMMLKGTTTTATTITTYEQKKQGNHFFPFLNIELMFLRHAPDPS